MSASAFHRFNNLGRHGEADGDEGARRCEGHGQQPAAGALGAAPTNRRLGRPTPAPGGGGAHACGLGGGGAGAMRSPVVCWAAPTPVERVMGHARVGVGEGGRRRHRWRWRRTGQLR